MSEREDLPSLAWVGGGSTTVLSPEEVRAMAAYRKCSVEELLAYYEARTACQRECHEMGMDVVTTAMRMSAIPTPNRKAQK